MENNFLMGVFFLGIIFCMIMNFMDAFINYLLEESWLKHDYENIIAEYLNPDRACTPEDKRLIIKAHKNYNKNLQKKENLNKLLNKLKFKKRK